MVNRIQLLPFIVCQVNFFYILKGLTHNKEKKKKKKKRLNCPNSATSGGGEGLEALCGVFSLAVNKERRERPYIAFSYYIRAHFWES